MPPKGAKQEAPPPQEEIVFERTEYEEQCDRIFKDLDRAFKKLHKISKPEKIHIMIKDITAKLKEAKLLIKDFEREARADQMPASELTARKREMASQLNGFIEMKKHFAQAEGSKGDLLSGAQPEADLVLEGMSMNQLVNKGQKEIADIDKILERTHRVAEETKQVGVALGETLGSQTKQMEKVVDDLNEIEFTMKKASEVIRDITRGLLTDKCIAFLLLLVVVGVVAIIVVKIINPNRDKVQQGVQAAINETVSQLNETGVISAANNISQTISNNLGRRMLVHKALLHLLDHNARL